MAVSNKGKIFEDIFKHDFLKSLPSENTTIDRLVDVMTGYKNICNVSDFIGYSYPYIFYLECKSHRGNTFNFKSDLRQYDNLVRKIGIKGVRSGVILWMIDHDSVFYIPAATIKQMKADGKKSFNINDYENYRIFEIPTIVKRTYPTSDYSILLTLQDGD